MRKRDKGFWIAYLVFAIIMLLIYKYIPAENGFLVIVLFPLIYWLIYEFILRPKKRRSIVTFDQKQNEAVNQNKEQN
ncbi:hypothetical protein ABEY50_07955 [Priestia megaterium]|uniref:hypothetical protein n=1 Tax=Priestia megaterium TaxID=1404 RepID=UPI000BFCA08F|nr:hypothetical protein [Priestia megaterium]MEB2292288.1 hypothetical protein [Priestia megaterium]MEE3894829.1 hypothetical protein [Priestia megaterium]PGK24611.1 hypothetical protein CN902_25480 [Priestia megaterium]